MSKLRLETVRVTCDFPKCGRKRDFLIPLDWNNETTWDYENALKEHLWKGETGGEDFCLFHNSDNKEYVG